MVNLLIEEEQISLLGKMLYYSAKHLTTRERETYDQLVEHLMRKVNQLRVVEQQTSGKHSTSSHISAQIKTKQDALKKLRPEEICKYFIDAWNKQDFETEYLCLSHSFPIRKKKTDSIHEYVLQRMKKYQNRRTVGPKSKKIVEVSPSPIHGNKASVYCIELHKMPDKNLTLHREYDMIYEADSWRIADYTTIKSHDSPIDKR
jgi:hypothetical protein